RHRDRRISLREIALSHKGVPLESGVAPLWEGPNRAAIGPIGSRPPEAEVVASLDVIEIGAFRCAK
ncbi:MAG: hypothetical protein JJU22_15745, partial [Gammaproteobacteria bacterium]|nr:hypothetical protein [Gammaproteobacteria bacterium]